MSTAAPEPDVGAKAVRGVAWTMGVSLGTRALQTLGTLVLANVLGRETTGDVTNAAVITMSAHQLSVLGVPHYLITRKTGRDVAWHASVVMAVTGLLAVLPVVAMGGPLGRLLKSPATSIYLPGLAVSMMLTRMAIVPERILQQNLRFRAVSGARGASELAYTLVSVGLVLNGAGGMSMVWGNVARSALLLVLMSMALPPREWLTPHPISSKTLRDMLAFGVPIAIAVVLSFGSRYWDNLVVSGLFGAAVVGAYNQAYNLADIPASQLGEQIGDVLTPSLSHLDPEKRKTQLVRSTALLGLIVFPLAIGLGAVADTLVATILRPEWALAAPMLTVLSALSVVRPIGWTIGSYLQTTNRTRTILWLSVLKVTVLFSSIAALGSLYGPVAACFGVGIAFALHALASVWVVSRVDGIPPQSFLRALVPPLLACAPMVGAVLGVRKALAVLGVHVRGLNVGLEVVAGGLVYVAAAFVVARPVALDLLRLARSLLSRPRARRAEPAP